jgi:hypothetical protein
MNINLRALVFGTAVAAVLTTTMNVVAASPTQQVVCLDRVTVTAHRENFDVDGNLKAVRLDAVVVTARKRVA